MKYKAKIEPSEIGFVVDHRLVDTKKVAHLRYGIIL